MQKFIDNLKRQAQENPALALAIGAAVITATAKLIEANNDRQKTKTWEQEVNRRIMNQR